MYHLNYLLPTCDNIMTKVWINLEKKFSKKNIEKLNYCS
jgi:hypothetical protein